MALTTCFRFACCFVLLSLTAAAQDPFGGGGADPFGGGNKSISADPFAARVGADPFGSAQETDPVSKHAGANSTVAHPWNRAEDRIRGMLDADTTVTAVDLPVQDLAQLLSEMHDIPILVDDRSLEEIGLSRDAPVTISLKNISLRSCLRLSLQSLDLTYMIKDEVLQITTKETEERYLVVQTYRFPDSLVEKSDQVLRALTTTVQPDQWDAKGGPCNAAIVDNVLVVSATGAGHESVVDFLDKLQEAIEGP